MSRDADLFVSCPCGCTTIQKRGGYETCDLEDAKDLGHTASMLCRRKRLKRRLYFLAVGVVASAILIAGIGWIVGEKRKMDTVKAEEWSWRAERYLRAEEYANAVEAYTKAIELHPTVRAYLSRAFAYDELGRLEAAVEDCRLAVLLDPENQAASRTLARIKTRLADR